MEKMFKSQKEKKVIIMMLCYTLSTQNDPYERHSVQRYTMMIYKP